jgi:hypothetical protein
VDAFVCDGASYNLAAFKRLKETLNPKMICVWCICHMLERVGDAVTTSGDLQEVKVLLTGIKKLFNKSRKRRSKWIAHLSEQGVQQPTQICRFGDTRWGSWYESAFDVLCYITNIPSFLRSLSNDKSPTVIDRLRQLLSNNATLQTIHLKLSFLHDVFEPMVRLLLKYQAHAVYAHKVFGDVDDFRVALSPLSDSDFDTLPSVSKFAASQPEKAGWLLAKHPSWNFFKAARIFNPYHVKRRGIPEPRIFKEIFFTLSTLLSK